MRVSLFLYVAAGLVACADPGSNPSVPGDSVDAIDTSPDAEVPCEGGLCEGDPCLGVTCDQPPSGCYAATGTCQSGVCSYAPADGVGCDDGDACTADDRCAAGTCAGAPVTCATAPADVCLDATTLTVYDATGTCGGSGCSYAARNVVCASGCALGACLGDPCAGVVCNTPPSACHDPAGTCVSGVCRYDFDNGVACDDGDACTSNDRCEAGACSGTTVACTTPPAATCSAGNLEVSAASGSCVQGACAYGTTTVACALGCDPAGGACAGDPCANVTCTTPPATSCVDGVVHSFAQSGTCSGGSCSYVETTTACAYGCAGSACAAPNGIVISEVLYDSVAADDDVFVELHGPAGASLAGLTLVGKNGNGGADYQPIALVGTFDSQGLFVVAHPDADPSIADFADQLANSVDYQNGPDTIVVRFDKVVLDAVGYGTFTGADVFAGEGAAHPGIPSPATGVSLTRDPSYTDTDHNDVDFTIAVVPTPGAPSVIDTTFDDCLATTVQWGVDGCSAPITAGAHGAVRAPRNATFDKSGAATVTCDDGEWIVSDAACAVLAPRTLSVTRTGSGVVTSARQGIDCGLTCSATFYEEEIIELTAVAADRSHFTGWSGGCSGTAPTCSVALGGGNVQVSATFELDPVWVDMATDSATIYAVRSDGTLWAAGDRVPGFATKQTRLVRVGDGSDWSEIDATFPRVCGLRGGQLWCWGDEYVGDGTTNRVVEPARIGVESDWTQVASGSGFSCGLRGVGQLWCWGDNDYGATGTSAIRLSPTRVDGNEDWTTLSAGYMHVCAYRNGKAWCWGDNGHYQIGGPQLGYIEPRVIPDLTSPNRTLTAVVAGGENTCVITELGQAHCFGDNSYGASGFEGTDELHRVGLYETQERPIGGWTDVLHAEGSIVKTCALRAPGTLWCWSKWPGLGMTPIQVLPGDSWVAFDPADGNMCALRGDGTLWCYGNNTGGQLGNGMTIDVGRDLAVELRVP